MKVAFRVDASLQMGTGHVMRCLALADALKAQGAECHFISREHPGHLLDMVQQREHQVHRLPAAAQGARESTECNSSRAPSAAQEPTHQAWLGSTWQEDARETETAINSLRPEWLVVDHYALDHRWEQALAAHYRKLLVIDDLADRPHHCNLLLDQNLGREPEHYDLLVPPHCKVLAGPRYALLRPEFAALRPYSLQRRLNAAHLRKLLITMGGVDQPNATGQVLQALKSCDLPTECHITVVMGQTAPWLANVQKLAAQMPWPTEVVVDVSDMARRMADSDLAIGAAGSTSWERCCLGLPSLMVVLADNQIEAATHLRDAGAACLVKLNGHSSELFSENLEKFIQDPSFLRAMSTAASTVSDGSGTPKMAHTLMTFPEK